MPQIWINNSWYIPVDSKGYFEGKCPEGVLGSILTIRLRDKPKSRLALKIPRLLADTIQENAYISEIAEDEARSVYDIFNSLDDKEGLVQCRYIENAKGVIARPRTLHTGIGEDGDQNNHVIFVSFEKGRPPRLCSVDFSETKLSVYPEDATEDIKKFLDANTWKAMAGEKPGVYTAFERTALCAIVRTSNSSKIGEQSISCGLLQDTTDSGQPLQAWYAGIPSIVFDWGAGNLQESVGRGRLKDWSVNEHLLLFVEIFKGMDCLHRIGMLHGDIRPANVMAIGDPSKPSAYKLGDYGGFRADGPRMDMAGEGTGQTRIGPTLGKGRVSPFYSPERRAGVESENADVALVLRANNRDYFIWVGWRSELIDADTDRPIPAVMSKIREMKDSFKKRAQGTKEAPSDVLWAGDRLRLRDYMFEILEADVIDGNLCCICKKRFFRVIHDRMTVIDDGPGIEDGEVISLAQYTEYRQWSAATDLYGAGAVALYCLFTSSRQQDREKQGKSQNEYAINADFGEMLAVLESIPYFSVFWTQLEEVREVLESLPLTLTATQAAAYVTATGKKLHQMVENAVNNMVQSAPNVRAVLAMFHSPDSSVSDEQTRWNMAHFVLFMHFVLSCLHRQNHLPKKNKAIENMQTRRLPFCISRTEKPREKGPAYEALERLRQLSDLFKHPIFSGLTIEPKSVPDFDPRSDFLVRLDDKELTQRVLEIIAQSKLIKAPLFGDAKAAVVRLATLIANAEKTIKEIEARSYNTR